MLKGIDPRLDADMLHALRAMGHGDTLVLVDANFPALSMARDTVLGAPLRIDAPRLADAAEAVLSLMPLDTFVDNFAARMQVVGAPDALPDPIAETQRVMADAGEARVIPQVDRFAFYDLARAAFAIVQTGERRLYGNVMLRKGVIPPEED
ncbi:L-fucose mutarotase [Jannaschia seosinensis]|uniref:L-fucose mutarotase n=1 Tax=Jannaschia seosinensis TaxID=313367 RepID=A0A0M7BEY8_9RHOB|nr:RbsD/FucU domain-containing protein [Jannaschia seosinensis]CUH40352.1 L-fucose mutarotase [Jannaschia seosinensis]